MKRSWGEPQSHTWPRGAGSLETVSGEGPRRWRGLLEAGAEPASPPQQEPAGNTSMPDAAPSCGASWCVAHARASTRTPHTWTSCRIGQALGDTRPGRLPTGRPAPMGMRMVCVNWWSLKPPEAMPRHSHRACPRSQLDRAPGTHPKPSLTQAFCVHPWPSVPHSCS